MTDRIKAPGRSPIDNSKVMKWKNLSGEEIPAYGVVKLQSYVAADDYFEAVKPDGEGALHFVNGPVAVAVDAFGGSQMWDVSRIGKTSGAFGEVVGPVDGSWEMTTEGTGWVVFSTPGDGVAALLKDGGGGASVSSDGKVHSILPCGWYMIELGTIEEEIGSASGSGEEENCSPCADNASGSGNASSSGCDLILSPSPVRVVGNGTYVMAYDPQSVTIPLVLGSDCVVTKVSGVADGSGSGSVSGSGSGAAGSVTPWRVVRGYQEHIVQYKEDGACCGPNGEWVTTRKKPIVFVGKECDWIECDSCPSGST